MLSRRWLLAADAFPGFVHSGVCGGFTHLKIPFIHSVILREGHMVCFGTNPVDVLVGYAACGHSNLP
jgi:hypothetical protein